MANMIARLWPLPEIIRPNRRKASRRTANAAASITTMNGDTSNGFLSDVSTNGCCFLSESQILRIGQFVSIAPEEGKPVQAIVRWIRDSKAGMEFLRPLGPDHEDWLNQFD